MQEAATAQPITDPDLPIYSIGSVARMLGVSVFTLRMYEREGVKSTNHASIGT